MLVVGYIAEPRSAGGSAHPSAGRAPPTYRSSRACCSWWSCWWWSTPRSRAAPLPGGVAAHPSPGVAPRPEPDGDDVREPRAAACGAAGRCHTRHAGWDYLLVRVSRLHPPCGGSGSSDGSSASMNTSGSRPRSGRAIAARRESQRSTFASPFCVRSPAPCGHHPRGVRCALAVPTLSLGVSAPRARAAGAVDPNLAVEDVGVRPERLRNSRELRTLQVRRPVQGPRRGTQSQKGACQEKPIK